MLTEVLAAYAAVVSTSSLGVSYFSYRSGGPRLSGSAEIYGGHNLVPILDVYIYNRGRGPITIDSIDLWGLGNSATAKGTVPVVTWSLHSSSCVLPTRVEAHSGERWHFPAHHVAEYWIRRSNVTRIVAYIGLATGKTLKLKVDTSNIAAPDRYNLPDWQPDYFPESQADNESESVPESDL